MKIIFLACVTLCLTTQLHAQVVTKYSASGTENDVKLGVCHFKLHDAFNGEIRLTTRSKPQLANYSGSLMRDSEKSEVSIKMSCRNVLKDELRDCGLELKDGKLNTSGTDQFTEEEKKQFHEELITFVGKNWKGAGVQSEYTFQNSNQNRDIRVKDFSFCLRHDEVVLTGSVSAVAEVGKPKESALPNIIKLLESVEFIDVAEGNSTPDK